MTNKKLISFLALFIVAYSVLHVINTDNSEYVDIELSDNELLALRSNDTQEIIAAAATNAGAISKFLNGNLPTTTPSGNIGVPNLLSETGAFSDLVTLTPNQGLIPYDMIEPFWSDGADKKRWMAIPNDGTYDAADEQITYSTNDAWDFPRGSVLVKHFEIDGQRLETRFEVKGDDDVYYFLTYKWNSAGTDATILTGALDEDILVGGVTQSWHYPSRTECMSCHFPQNGSVLGPKTRNLNKEIFYPGSGTTMNQLVYYSSLGLITETITNANVNTYPAVAAKDDLSASLEDRARSYIDVNCSSCHNPTVENVATFDARYSTPLENQNIVYGPVVYDEGLTDPKVIIPQDVANSMAHFRMNSTQTGIEMPPIAKDVVDTAGVQLIEDWINSLAPATSSPPVALFSASVVNGQAPLSVDFDATATTDNDNDPLTYTWDFGDGNTGSGLTISHIFTTSAEFTVTLTVSDGEFTDIASTIITVNSTDPGGNTVAFSDNTDTLLGQDNYSGLPMGVIDMNGDGKDDIVQFNNARELRIQYQNNPGQQFTSHYHGSVSGSNQWGTVIADFDHNGFNDVMSGGAYDNLKIVRNNDGNTSFSQSTLGNSNIFLQGANFADINNDGWADIFACHDDAESRAYQNNQDGTLTFNESLISTETVPASDNSGNYASMWVDYDNDGDLDLYISKCRGGVNSPTDPRRINMLWQNDGNNNYVEVAEQANLKIGDQTWLSDFGDIDNDGDLDAIVINHFSGPNLMRNNGDGTFTEVTTGSGLMPTLDPSNFYGIQGFFKDFNNDGFLDLMVSGDNHYIFYNNGDGTFQNAPNPFSSNQIQSFSVGDINHDGFLDIYAGYATGLNSPSSAKDRIWINQGNSNNYLNIQLVGTLSNINAIGARVEVYGSWGKQIRDVKSGEGYGLVNTFTQHFGLGVSSQVEKVVVHWPSGIVDEVLNPAINQFLQIIETEPTPTCDDGFQNGDETGVDCGGSCDPCPPTCDDGIQNGDETGVDCGGSCDPCPIPCTENEIVVSITFDNYPEETSWSIQNSSGVTVASGGTYADQSDGATLDIEACLGDGCYDFIIDDAYGDGICCGFGNGSYTVTANGLTVASGATFGEFETTNFCLGGIPCEGVDLTIFNIDFENGTGTDWTTSGDATTGTFIIGDPTAQVSGVQTQPEDDHSSVGTNAFFTATNTSIGVDDIDNGVSIATSPIYPITPASNLSIWYFFGQRDAGNDAGDYFLLEYSIDGGTNYTTLASYGDETVEAQWTRATAQIPENSSLVIRVSAADGIAAGDIIEAGIDDLLITEICQDPVTYTFINNIWSPTDPNNTSSYDDAIVVATGEAVISMNTEIDAITVQPGAALTINSGVTLSATTTNLRSTSQMYSSLILDGTLTGTINYERHVNINGSGTTGSNDLISAPLTGQEFDDFALANPNILNNGTLYLFGPFDKNIADYITYAGTSTETLDAGVGYRAASSDNSTFTFTGTAQNGMITHDISHYGPSEPEWNLVGNPYPSYLNVWDFLNHEVSAGVKNIDLMNAGTAAIYGYDGNAQDGWKIYNFATTTPAMLLAPGQGFFVSANPTFAPLYDLEFSPDMRATGTSDDFIEGRFQYITNYSVLSSLKLSSASQTYNTRIYFIEGTTRGLDQGYDACAYGGGPDDFSIFTSLVEGNQSLEIAIQSLPYADFNDIVIPLGVKAQQGVSLTISINEDSTLFDSVNVYLEDTLLNTYTLLNNSDYVFTPNTDLTGTGRFYLRYSNETLSTENFELNDILIYSHNDSREIYIKGQLSENSIVNIFDIQGRLVKTSSLDQSNLVNKVNVNTLSSGVYMVQLQSGNTTKTKKLIIN